jgi:ABC-type spermidine/putrescine transport system permease subunit II
VAIARSFAGNATTRARAAAVDQAVAVRAAAAGSFFQPIPMPDLSIGISLLTHAQKKRYRNS